MYKLFAAAHAIEFSLGCHARWSNLVVKSNELPLASIPGLSAPVITYLDICKYNFVKHGYKERKKDEKMKMC